MMAAEAAKEVASALGVRLDGAKPTTWAEACDRQIAHSKVCDETGQRYNRYLSLREGFEVRHVPEHGMGLFTVNVATGKVCEWNGQWDPTGKVLLCVDCFEDGT